MAKEGIDIEKINKEGEEIIKRNKLTNLKIVKSKEELDDF